jgi:hypothetical protein
MALEYGYDHVINYNTEDFVTAFQRSPVARASMSSMIPSAAIPSRQSLDCLKRLGMFVSFGQSSGPIEDFTLALLAQKGSLFAPAKSTLCSAKTAPANRRWSRCCSACWSRRGQIVWNGQPVSDRVAQGVRAQTRHRHGVPAFLAVRGADGAENIALSLDDSIVDQQDRRKARALSQAMACRSILSAHGRRRSRSASASASRSSAACCRTRSSSSSTSRPRC